MVDTILPVAVSPIGPIQEPDAHGQAALLLAESMLHALVDGEALSNHEAVEVLRIASEVKVETATAAGESSKRMNESLELLARMRASFETDEPTGPRVPPLHVLDSS